MKSFSLSEIAQHNTAESCYAIIHNKVYDLTSYINSHPGGPNLILKGAGSDLTGDFEGMFHSAKARDILERYVIGYVEGRENQSSNVSMGGRLLAWRNLSGGNAASKYYNSNYLNRISGQQSTNQDQDEDQEEYNGMKNYMRPRDVYAMGSNIGLNGRRMTRPIPSGSHSGSFSRIMNELIYQKYKFIGRKACEGRNSFILKFKLPRPTARLPCPLGYHIQVRVHLKKVNSIQQGRNEKTMIDTLNIPSGQNITQTEIMASSIESNLTISKEEARNGSIKTVPPEDGHLLETVEEVMPEPINILERKYTPTNISENGYFELLVKCYPNELRANSVSYYLCHELQYHEEIEIRGPIGIYQYIPNKTKYLGIIVCGSGITPVYRIIESIVNNRKVDQTKIILLYANRSEDDIILKSKLDEWAEKDGSNFKISYVLSQPKLTNEKKSPLENISCATWNKELVGHITTEMAQKYFLPEEMKQSGYIPKRRDFFTLLCGTDGFVRESLKICDQLKLNTQSQVHVF